MRKPAKFFDEKKTWSLMKDRILGWYLVPYVSKVKRFAKTVVVVDGFAGYGIYEDGSEGSPLIICRVLDELKKAQGADVLGIFIEKDPTCFTELEKNLRSYRDSGLAVTLHGDFKTVAPRVAALVSESPTLFYIDPFGIKGLEFDRLEKILRKVHTSSTEVLVNFSYKALLREADAVPDLAANVMGGTYFQDVLRDPIITRAQKEAKIVQLYEDRYRKYFAYVGSCPVLYKDDRSAKYHLLFGTGHFDGFKLMNTRMGDIYREFYSEGRLFELTPPDKARDLQFLEEQVLDVMRRSMACTRADVEKALIPTLFMRYREGDYKKVITGLLKEKKLFSETGRVRINDSVRLALRPFIT